MSSAEQLAKQVDKFRQSVELLKKSSASVLDPAKDTAAARKKSLDQIDECNKKRAEIAAGLETGKTLEGLDEAKKIFRDAVKDLEAAAKAVKGRIRDTETLSSPSAQSAPQQGSRQTQQVVQLKSNELHTEEHLQATKLKQALEVEELAREVHQTTHEFHRLVHEQQHGIDTMNKNLASASDSMKKGTDQLKAARKLQ
jgi:hypothetical protein